MTAWRAVCKNLFTRLAASEPLVQWLGTSIGHGPALFEFPAPEDFTGIGVVWRQAGTADETCQGNYIQSTIGLVLGVVEFGHGGGQDRLRLDEAADTVSELVSGFAPVSADGWSMRFVAGGEDRADSLGGGGRRVTGRAFRFDVLCVPHSSSDPVPL